MATYDSTDLFINKNNQELDLGFSVRRNKRTPLEENSLIYSYSYLEDEMKNPDSFIYKGQIVVTQGTYNMEGEPTGDLTYFSPWLIKNENDKDNTKFYADRIVTSSYNKTFLEARYVRKSQLGTYYTGVGQWADVKGKEEPSTTYSEIFNDYNYNFISIHENDIAAQPFLKYAHAEGTYNSVYMSYAHAEGFGNIVYGSASHVEGSNNTTKGEASHAEGFKNSSNGQYSHVQGDHSESVGASSFAGGSYSSAIGIGSVALGNRVVASGNYSTAVGFNTQAQGESAHAEGNSVAAVGKYSHAEGYNTKGTGEASHVEGSNSEASGNYSHAEGQSTIASGKYSHAEGISSIVRSEGSHVEGNSTIEEAAKYSHAEGQSTITTGQYVHAEGKSTVNGDYAHGEGNSTVNGESAHGEGSSTATGKYSHAEAQGTAIGEYTHAEGTSTASGQYAHAEGIENTASGKGAHAEGNNTTSTGQGAHAEGNETQATNKGAHAEGTSTISSGEGSHAEGYSTTASGRNSHSEGNSSMSSGTFSHAEGNSTEAIGEASHVEGKMAKAVGDYTHAEGNKTIADGMYSHVEGNNSKAIGEGSHAEGTESEAHGIGSHVEGYQTISGKQKKDKDNASIKSTNYGHAEGYSTSAVGDYTHVEGYMSATFDTAAHAEGYNTHARGKYSHTGGYNTLAPNESEFAIGKWNRAYTTGTVEGQQILDVPNEFARLNGKYIPGRYPTGITDNNKTDTAYYDSSYESMFTIGNGSSGALSSSDLVEPDPDYPGTTKLIDAGATVKATGRHNVIDIRKNGQMYYDGGVIVGGETVAPVSYSYVASLGPTAYLTTVMRALLVQPEYYRPSLQYALWYTGNSTHNAVSSSNSVGWAYFQAGVNSNGICEVGATTNFQLQFRAFNVGVDKPQNLDPLYGTSLGNMLGYSTGVTNVTYQVISSSNLSAQTFTTKQDNELLAGMQGSLKYTPKKIDALNYDYGGFGPFDAFRKDYTAQGTYAPLAYYCSYCNAVDNRGAFNESNGNYNTGLYSTRQVVANSIKFDKEGRYTIWKATSYTFNPATQMYFQQLAEKGTYIPDNGVAPMDKFTKTTVTSSATFTMDIRYRIYYGVTNTVPTDDWKSWTQTDLLGHGEFGHGHVYGNMNAASGSTQSQTQAFSSTAKTCWFAFPEDIYKLTRYNHAAVPSTRYMYYKNAMNAESSLDTGRITDVVSSARPMYEYVTTNGINPSGLKYHIVAVSAPAGITKGTWGFCFQRK